MKDMVAPSVDPALSVPILPDWVRQRPAHEGQGAAFHAGAALATLQIGLRQTAVPVAVLRARLALRAAEASVILNGRSERAAALRDEVHLLRPGDQPGPAGRIYQHWQQAVAHPMDSAAFRRTVPLPRRRGFAAAPLDAAAGVLAEALSETPHDETAALIRADAILARSLGWSHLVPLLGVGLSGRDLRRRDAELHHACQRAVIAVAEEAIHLARDLARKGDRLHRITPKLRARNAEKAVARFLERDALSPSLGLTDLMTDRAARRFCDRLVDLGAIRELTGRATFRLYGL